MFNEDEINLIGIVQESELRGITSERELKRIVCDALGIAPLLPALISDMNKKGLITTGGSIYEKDVVTCLYSDSFLKSCPKVSVLDLGPDSFPVVVRVLA